MIDADRVEWLLDGDPAIRWQTMRDLLDAPAREFEAGRGRVGETGWGRRLPDQQGEGGSVRPWSGPGPDTCVSAVVLGLLEWFVVDAQARREGLLANLLERRLFRSRRTDEVINPEFSRFSFPSGWHYDVLRALDHCQDVEAPTDPRAGDAIELVRAKRRDDGT